METATTKAAKAPTEDMSVKLALKVMKRLQTDHVPCDADHCGERAVSLQDGRVFCRVHADRRRLERRFERARTRPTAQTNDVAELRRRMEQKDRARTR